MEHIQTYREDSEDQEALKLQKVPVKCRLLRKPLSRTTWILSTGW